MLSVKHKFIFIHIPKTGGNSINRALLKYSDDDLVVNNNQHRYNQLSGDLNRFSLQNQYITVSKHATLKNIYDKWEKNTLGEWNEYLKFSCVRNTWDRLISFYFSPHQNRFEFDSIEFEVFIRKMTHKSQDRYFILNNKIETDCLIRFEKLNEDFTELTKKIGIETSLPHINKSNHQPYQYYYTASTKELVAQLYKKEIELLGFTFD